MDVTPIFCHSFKSPWLQYWWAGGWIEKKHLYTNTLAVYNLWSLLVKNLSNCCPETHNWRVIMDILFIMFIIVFVNRKKFKKLWMRCAVCFLTRSRQRWGIIINSHLSLSPWSSISGLDASSVMPFWKKLCLWWDVFHGRTRNMFGHECWLDQRCQKFVVVVVVVKGSVVAFSLVCSPTDQAVQFWALTGNIVLCSWARHLTITVPLSHLSHNYIYIRYLRLGSFNKQIPANLKL